MSLRQFILCFACLTGAIGVAPLASAQLSLPSISGKTKAPTNTVPIAEEQARAEARLAETERQRSIQAIDDPDVNEQQHLLVQLATLQGDRLKRLGDIATLQQASPPSLESNPLVKQLGESPPYSAVHVDALRDELDGMREKFQALQAGQVAREKALQQKKEQLQRAGEALRLAADKLAQASGDTAISQARRQQELADLRQQIAEARLALLAVEQEWTRLQSDALKRQIEQLQVFIADILPMQRLSPEEVEQQRQRMQVLQAGLLREIEQATASKQRHALEHEKLGVKASAGTDQNIIQRRNLLEQALETDRILLQGLRNLQLLAEVTTQAWEHRYEALSATDEAKRASALQSLNKIYVGLAARRPSQETGDVTRVAIREQENRIASLPAGSGEMAREQEVRALLLKRIDINDRVEQAASRFERQLARWLADVAQADKHSLARQAAVWGGHTRQWLAGLWNYELFAVEDISEVDGRRVTVSYGVTVGKSIGALLLFIVGYWLFARLVRKLQEILVRRFGIAPEVAHVIRRWVMIILAVLLIIFVLNLARIPLTVFAFLGGALAIGIGFGTQTIIKNFISGIIILFERKIRVGDIIELGGMAGQVTAVDLRSTTVRGFDGVEALVPNSNFLENQVVNWTYSNPQIRREVKVGVAYGSDTRQAEALLLAIAAHHPEVLKVPAPEVFFEDFADSALLLALVYWVELGPGRMARRIDSELRHAIYAGLNEAGIAIAFPQRDVHLDTQQPLQVAIVGQHK